MGLSRLVWGWDRGGRVAAALGTGRIETGRARGATGKLRRVRIYLGEALLLTLFGALWFGSLGAGAWWLVFGLVGRCVVRDRRAGGRRATDPVSPPSA